MRALYYLGDLQRSGLKLCVFLAGSRVEAILF